MDKQVDLKECPFCGGIAKLWFDTVCIGHGEYIVHHFVLCDSCYASSHSVGEFGISKDEAIKQTVEAWNRRIKE